MCTDMYINLHTHILMHIHMCTQRYLVCSTELHLYNCLGCLMFPGYSSGLSDKFHWLSALPGRSLTLPSPPSHTERHTDRHQHLCRGCWATCWAGHHLNPCPGPREQAPPVIAQEFLSVASCAPNYLEEVGRLFFSLFKLPPLASEKRLNSQEES